MAGSYHAVNQLEIPLIIPNVRIRTPAYPGLYTFLLKLLFPTNFQNCLVFSLVRFLAEGKKDRSSAGSYPTPFKAFMWENESALHNHSIKKPILFQMTGVPSLWPNLCLQRKCKSSSLEMALDVGSCWVLETCGNYFLACFVKALVQSNNRWDLGYF